MTLYTDSFDDGSLNSVWNWIDPLADSSYSEASGKVTITIGSGGSAHDIWGSVRSAPRIMAAITGDFDARLTLTPWTTGVVGDPRCGGILICDSDLANAMRFILYADQWDKHTTAYQNTSGSGSAVSGVTSAFSGTTLSLRITRTGTTYKFYRSVDGGGWTQIGGDITRTQTMNYLGFSAQGKAAFAFPVEEFVTDVIYFAQTVAPTGIASAEALGSPTLTIGSAGTVAPTGIASGEAFGTPVAAGPVSFTGIASAEALGSPTVFIQGAKVATLTDTFTTTLDTNKWTASGTVNISSDTVSVVAGPGTYSGITSVSAYDLTESAISVKLVEQPGAASNAETFFRLTDVNNGANYIDFARLGTGTYTFYRCTGQTGGIEDEGLTPPNCWWKISETGGTVTLSSSSNGDSWTTEQTFTTPSWASNVKVGLISGDWDSGQTPTGSGRFDNLNVVNGRPKVYVGAAWTRKPLKVYIGGVWVEKPLKRYNGSAWVPV